MVYSAARGWIYALADWLEGTAQKWLDCDHVFYLHPHLSLGWLDSETLTVINCVERMSWKPNFHFNSTSAPPSPPPQKKKKIVYTYAGIGVTLLLQVLGKYGVCWSKLQITHEYSTDRKKELLTPVVATELLCQALQILITSIGNLYFDFYVVQCSIH